MRSYLCPDILMARINKIYRLIENTSKIKFPEKGHFI